jgi:hypothetical protein
MKFIGQLLARHLRRYPAMQLDDIYKLLHQAALGPGHAVTNPAAARKRLDEEIAALDREGDTGEGPDIISPDGRLARVHLRPYLAAGGSVDALNRAFVDTANTYAADPDKLVRFCGCLGDLAQSGAIPFERADLEQYFAGIAQDGYPAVHHSEAYRHAYHPAYRVVAVDRLQS